MTTTTTTPNLELALVAIFDVLGEPTDGWQHNALGKYKDGDAIAVKKINAEHLRDYYCKCLGFLGGLSTTQNPKKVLAAAANAAADHAQVRTLERISDGNAIAFESENPLWDAMENILRFLMPSELQHHKVALALVNDYDSLKNLEKEYPEDNLIKALLYLSKAKPDSPAFFTILAEAGMAAAHYVRSVEHQKISAAIAQVFS